MGKILQILIIETRDLAHAQTCCTRATWMRNIRLQASTLTRKYGAFQFGCPVMRTAVQVDGRCDIFSLLVVV